MEQEPGSHEGGREALEQDMSIAEAIIISMMSWLVWRLWITSDPEKRIIQNKAFNWTGWHAVVKCNELLIHIDTVPCHNVFREKWITTRTVNSGEPMVVSCQYDWESAHDAHMTIQGLSASLIGSNSVGVSRESKPSFKLLTFPSAPEEE